MPDEPTDPFLRGHSVVDRFSDGLVLVDQLSALDPRQAAYAVLATLTRTDLENIAFCALLTRLLPEPQEAHHG